MHARAGSACRPGGERLGSFVVKNVSWRRQPLIVLASSVIQRSYRQVRLAGSFQGTAASEPYKYSDEPCTHRRLQEHVVYAHDGGTASRQRPPPSPPQHSPARAACHSILAAASAAVAVVRRVPAPPPRGRRHRSDTDSAAAEATGLTPAAAAPPIPTQVRTVACTSSGGRTH